MVNVGSMEFLGLYKDMGLMIGLARIKTELTKVQQYVKSTGIEFFRLATKAKLLGAALGLIGAFGFAKLLMQAPRTSAALSLIFLYLELIANIMDRYVSPAVRWLADSVKWLYEKFKELDPWLQGAITWLLLIASAAMTVWGVLSSLGLTWSAIWAVIEPVALWITGVLIPAIAGSTGLTVALAALALILGYLALDKLGVIDWLDKMWGRLDDLVYQGSLLAAIFNLTTIPLRLLIDLVGILVGDRSWNDLLVDLESMGNSLKVIWNFMKKIANKGFDFLGLDAKFEMTELTDLTGMRSPPAAVEKTEIKKETIITGNTFELPNVTSAEDLLEELERMQAEQAAWEAGL